MNKIYSVSILILLFFINANAQSVADIEKQADIWAEKSFTQSKALKAYLGCFKDNNDKKARERYLDKTASILKAKKTLLKNDALTVDSMINESKEMFANDVSHYLPLLESRIIKASTSGKSTTEFNYIDEALSLREKNALKKGADYEQLLRKYIKMYKLKQNKTKEGSVAIYEELWRVAYNNRPSKDSLDVKLLDDYALACSFAKRYDTLVQLYELKKDYIVNTAGKENEEYPKLLDRLYLAYGDLHRQRHSTNSEEYSEERKHQTTYGIERYNYKTEHGTVPRASDVRSLIYDLTRLACDTAMARQLANNYVRVVEKNNGKESENYCEALDIVSNTYDNYDAACIPVLEELLKLQEKVYGKESLNYKATSSRLNLCYSNNHRMEQAINLQKEDSQNSDSPLDMTGILNLSVLANQKIQYGQFRDGINTYERILNYTADNADSRSYCYMISVLGITNAYHKLGDIDGLLKFGEKWSNDSRLTHAEQFDIFLKVNSVASLPKNAGENVLKFIDSYNTKHSTENSSLTETATINRQKALVFMGLEQYDKTEQILRQNIDILQKTQNQNPIDIIKAKLDLEASMMIQEKFQEALSQNQENLNSLMHLPNYQSLSEYLSLCSRAAIYHDRLDNFDKVLELCDIIDHAGTENISSLDLTGNYDALTICTSYMTDKSIVENQRYRALYKKGLYRDAEPMISSDISEKESLLKFSLSQMNAGSQQNIAVWTKQANDYLANFAVKLHTDTLTVKTMNFAILCKQAYLSAENLMKQQLLNSGNANIKAKFEELQNLKNTIKQYTDSRMPTSELSERHLQLERQLIEDSKMYGDFTSDLNMTWKDINRNLGADDIAVEILSYTSYDDDKEHFAAILLRPSWTAPRIIDLFSVSQIPANPYSDKTLTDMFWKKISECLDGVKNIYLSPSGSLYNIALESLPSIHGNGYISDDYNIWRLSSHRELIHRIENPKNESRIICLYGGLVYNTPAQAMIDDAKKYNSTASNENNIDRSLDIESIRGVAKGLPYLPGTKKEIDNIVETFSGYQGYNTLSYTGQAGTESSFKSLSGKGVSIAHISTHGFYTPRKDRLALSPVLQLMQQTEDESLNRSGLFFTGANNALSGASLPKNVDNGILTAHEISMLNLQGMELVNLSACETGLGDISGEGVFGLQRGFKKAGVKSILMSLWKVDDDATCFLMTEFYKNMMNNMTKHDALEKAKYTVRSKEQWNDPKYWAAFILLDALN